MKSTLIIAALLVLYVCSSSAYRTECTRNGGCVQYDRDGNGIRCGPDGCGPIGSGSSQRNYASNRNSGSQNNNRNEASSSRGAVACGIDGCKGFQDQGNGYGCGPNGCGPLGSDYQPITGNRRY